MAKSRDERFERLFKTYYQSVYSYFWRCGFKEDSKDLAQQLFLGVYKNMDAIRDEEHYIRRAARNHARNKIRNLKLLQKFLADKTPEELSEALGKSAPQEEALIDREQQTLRSKQINAVVTTMPPLTQECWRLREQQLKIREIAARLDISQDAVKARLYDARKRLREQTGEEFESEKGNDDET